MTDRAKARKEQRADETSSGSGFDPLLEGAAGGVIGERIRTMKWSARLGRFVTWQYDAARSRWAPEGVDSVTMRKLRVEVSDANEGMSVEEAFAEILREREAA